MAPGLPPGVDLVEGDIGDVALLARLVADATAVVHLAGSPSVAASFVDPVEYARTHVVGTAAVLTACRDAVARLVYVSSAEVYGQPAAGVGMVAETAPAAPRSPYGACKVGAEAMIAALAPATGLEAIVLRPFSVYGPGARRDGVLPTVLWQALHAEAVEVADLAPVRDYVFVDDVADALLRATRCPLPPGPPVTCNLASGKGVSVGDLAALALAVVGRSVPVRQARADRPATASVSRLVGDTRRAGQVLGWEATTPLEEGLRRTVTALAS